MSTARERSRTHSIPVDPDNGFRRVVVELSVPELPAGEAPVDFAEHVLSADRQATDTVIACTRGGVVVSEDLGASWEHIQIPELRDVTLRNSFTTAAGTHLLQGAGMARNERVESGEAGAAVAVLSRDWQLLGLSTPGAAHWHGTHSIDEAGGAIVYGEYPGNSLRPNHFRKLRPEDRDLLLDSHLFRSTDGGLSWRSVLVQDWRTIRHFHTVRADPGCAGRWWASSGDWPNECRVWESRDDGANWDEISAELPVDDVHPSVERDPRCVLRHTALAIRDDDLLWGADDFLARPPRWELGPDPGSDVPLRRQIGARVFRSRKDAPWRPECIGYVGNPVRSIVDLGPAYVLMTEAQTSLLGFCPQVLLLSKSEPFQLTPLMRLDNYAPGGVTGFTYSRASRAAKDGIFFSYRSQTDVFPDGPRILRWRVALE